MPPEKKKAARKPSPAAAKLPQISDAEWVVMKVVWQKGTATANQVTEVLENQIHWKPKTIQTLLARLVQKKALDYDKTGREYLFRPLVEAQDCMHAVSRSFLHRFFDGEVAPFLACFLEKEKLSREEIEELKRILDSKQP